MTRRADWIDRLSKVIAEHDAQPFAWGTSDCFNLVIDAAEAMTGEDPYPKDRRAKSERAAKAALKRRGFRGVDAALAKAYYPIPPAMARTGDIAVVLNNKRRSTCGIVAGRDIIVRDQERLARFPLSAARRAYRVD